MTSQQYLATFDNSYADDTPVSQVRFVVLDTETTGLDPRRDKIITIGALAVCDGEILLDDAFEVMLSSPTTTPPSPCTASRATKPPPAWTNRKPSPSSSPTCATA